MSKSMSPIHTNSHCTIPIYAMHFILCDLSTQILGDILGNILSFSHIFMISFICTDSITTQLQISTWFNPNQEIVLYLCAIFFFRTDAAKEVGRAGDQAPKTPSPLMILYICWQTCSSYMLLVQFIIRTISFRTSLKPLTFTASKS